jgi:hypothetical protein
LKKSNQKTFANWAPGDFTSTVQVSKSFLLLFFKKEALAFYAVGLLSRLSRAFIKTSTSVTEAGGVQDEGGAQADDAGDGAGGDGAERGGGADDGGERADDSGEDIGGGVGGEGQGDDADLAA